MARQTLEQWIFEVLTDDDKEGKCTALALVHKVGVRDQEIHVKQLGSRQWDAKDLAKFFRDKAENHASEIPGVQSYVLLAFYNNRSEAQAQRPMLVNGEAEFSGLATEGPTEKGLLQQMMRHTEATLQISGRQSAMLFETMSRTMTELANSNHRLMVENREATEVVRDAVLQLATNREKSEMERLQFERATAERSKWMGLLPAAINGITGKEIIPQATADTQLLETIAESLDEEGIMKLANSGAIKPEIIPLIMKRFTQIIQRKREAISLHREALNGTDPEDDAAGGLQ